MEFIVYSSNIKEQELINNNITISNDAQIGENVKIYFGVTVLGNSCIGDNVELHSNSYIEDSNIQANCKIYSSHLHSMEIGNNCLIKPFTNLSASSLGDNCVVGNFCVMNLSCIGNNCNIGSLTQLDGVDAGNNLIMQCGVCALGSEEYNINIGDNVEIGANSTVVAPIIISDDAKIVSNSVVSQNIEVGGLATNNIKQINKVKR